VIGDKNGSVPSEPIDDRGARLFRAVRPLLHSVLVIQYRFTEENARDAEADLDVWFQRMVRRSARVEAGLREALVVAVCEYARSAQLWRLEGKPSGDARFDRFLARDAREVAAEIIRKMES
jgi:hypothetical protein